MSQYEYGITTSHADVWVHVCPFEHGGVGLYLYWRSIMLKKINELNYCQKKIASATGYLVPCDQPHIRHVWVPPFEWNSVEEFNSDTSAGMWAERIFKQASILGFIPNLFWPRLVEAIDRQYQGVDFEAITYPQSYETKMDSLVEQTGNLFVQTHELHHKHSQRNAHLMVVT